MKNEGLYKSYRGIHKKKLGYRRAFFQDNLPLYLNKYADLSIFLKKMEKIFLHDFLRIHLYIQEENTCKVL